MAKQGAGDSVKSAERALRILETIVGMGRPMSAQELGAVLPIPASSLSYLMTTLVSLDYLQRSGRDYAPGPALARLSPGGSATGIVDAVRPLVRSIRDRLDETTAFFTERDFQIEAIASAMGGQALRYSVEEGQRTPMHAFAAGKALLATFDAARLDDYFRQTTRASFTENTICEEADLRRELDRIRNSGIAQTQGEHTRGIIAIGKAAWRGGAALGAFSIAIPAARFDTALEARAIALLEQAVGLLAEG